MASSLTSSMGAASFLSECFGIACQTCTPETNCKSTRTTNRVETLSLKLEHLSKVQTKKCQCLQWHDEYAHIQQYLHASLNDIYLQWSSKVCIQNQSLLSRTVRVR